MNTKYYFIISILLAFRPLVSIASTTIVNPSIGAIAFMRDHIYLYTPDSKVKERATIAVQYPNKAGLPVCCVKLKANDLGDPTESDMPVSEEIIGSTIFRYEVMRAAFPSKYAMFVGLALISPNPSFRVSGTSREIRGSFSGRVLVKATSCFSEEGVHFFMDESKKMVSHLYYSLDYGVEPNCDPKLFSSE